ncbi:MAG: hypothetical protein MJK04_37175, partial [Psychrosphaera sp.]|nr:hypothetical protein [Psychrosphaera sp.]
MFKTFRKTLLAIGVLSLGVQFSAMAETTVTAVPVKSLPFYEQMGEDFVSSYEIESVILGRKILIEVFSMSFNEHQEQAVTFVTDGQVYGAISFIGDLVKTYDQQANLKPMITVAIDYTSKQANDGVAGAYRMLDLTHVHDDSIEVPQQ